MSLKGIDFEKLKHGIENAHILVILISDSYIESMKDPSSIDHVALNYQLQQAAKGKQAVFIIAIRPLSKDNFNLVMDMLEGSKLKSVIFVDRNDEEDMERAVRLLTLLMGPVRLGGTSGDSWILED